MYKVNHGIALTCTQVPGEEDMTLDVADGHVVGAVLVETLLTQEEEESHLKVKI
jgi:hypothetical protein